MTIMLLASVLTLTGLALYIAPQGRIALWNDWHFLGFSKGDYGAMHITSSILFILMGWLHTYFNWRSLVAYLKNRSKKLTLITRESLAALVLVVVFVGGGLYAVPPVYQLVVLGDLAKEKWEEISEQPPYGHAEDSSLKAFATWMRLEPGQAIDILKQNGLTLDNEKEKLVDIAASNSIPPSDIYNMLKESLPASTSEKVEAQEESVPSGLGRMTLLDFSQREQLDLKSILDRLAESKIEAAPDFKLKAIAENLDLTPLDLAERLKQY